MKKALVLMLCVTFLLSLTGCGKMSMNDAFEMAGIKSISSGTLYEKKAEVSKISKIAGSSLPDGINKSAYSTYIFDTEEEAKAEVASYAEYLLNSGWTEVFTDCYLSKDNKYAVSLGTFGPLSGDWEKAGFGGKYALSVLISFGE